MPKKKGARAPAPAPDPAPPTVALQRIEIDPQALMLKAIEAGADVDKLERLVDLGHRIRAEQAREAWHGAMIEFQRQCPRLVKNEEAKIQTRSGGSAFTYRYAGHDYLTSTVQPILAAQGLHISYRIKHERDRVLASCVISHEFGHHEESGEVAMPITPSATGNPGHAVGIAQSYAKRYALLAVLGLAPEDDPDANPNGKAPDVVPEPQRRTAAKQDPPAKPAARAATPPPAATSSPPPTPTTIPPPPLAVVEGRQVWTGRLVCVEDQVAVVAGSERPVYRIVAEDGGDFKTTEKGLADFARQAGASKVKLTWSKTPRGARQLHAIDPADV